MSTEPAQNTLLSRLRACLGLKLILMVVLEVAAYAPYLYLQNHHFFPVVELPRTFADAAIPFSAWTVCIYLSLYLLTPIGPFLMNKPAQIYRYAAGIMLISLFANLIFVFWPTVAPQRPDALGTNMLYRTLVAHDNRYHAFPSLHAAFAVYSAACGGLVLRELGSRPIWRRALWLWACLILYATLSTKQHFLVDIAAGSALGLGIYCVVFYKRNKERAGNPYSQQVPASLTP